MRLRSLLELDADLWVFDNDGTLYNNLAELEMAVGDLMIQYIASYYRISILNAKEKRRILLQKYNTKYTLIALRHEGISEDDFIQKTYLSIVPVDFGIIRSSKLKNLLLLLPGEKIVLTNNPSEFAELILDSLGVKYLFSKIIGMRERNYIQKPDIKAFELLAHWVKNGKRVVLIDDCQSNIDVAKSIGCITLHVKGGLL